MLKLKQLNSSFKVEILQLGKSDFTNYKLLFFIPVNLFFLATYNFFRIYPSQITKILAKHHSQTKYNWFDELETIKKAYKTEDKKRREIKGYIQQLNKDKFAVYMYTEKGNKYQTLDCKFIYRCK